MTSSSNEIRLRNRKVSKNIKLDRITRIQTKMHHPGLPKGVKTVTRKIIDRRNLTWFGSLWWVTHDAHTDDEDHPPAGLKQPSPL